MLRVIFAGTPAFACAALQALHAAGFAIALVLSQPDRPSGRGLKLQPSPVKAYALAHGLAVAQPMSLRLDGKYPEDAAQARLAIAAANADVMVVAAYGLLLPQWVLDTPRLGCINIHASLLPRWRGAAPIHRAIEAGDAETGITLMQMDAGLDTGGMLSMFQMPIGSTDTTGCLLGRLADMGAGAVVQLLRRAEQDGQFHPALAQPESGVTYAKKIDKSEAAIDWAGADADQLARRIRAFNPAPGASSVFSSGTAIKFWQAHALHGALAPSETAPGTVLAVGSEGIDICAAHGTVLRATMLQKPGSKPLPVAEFVRGFADLACGQRFG